MNAPFAAPPAETDDAPIISGDPRTICIGLTPADIALLDTEVAACHPPTCAALLELGISYRAMLGGSVFNTLHVGAVVFLQDGRFELAADMPDARGHVLAVLIPARDEFGETEDIVAWRPQSGLLATWQDECCLLGEDQMNSPLPDVDGLRVFPTLVAWLRGGRRGVFVLDADRARWRLAELNLVVEDTEFGLRLNDELRLPEPSIFVETEDAP